MSFGIWYFELRIITPLLLHLGFPQVLRLDTNRDSSQISWKQCLTPISISIFSMAYLLFNYKDNRLATSSHSRSQLLFEKNDEHLPYCAVSSANRHSVETLLAATILIPGRTLIRWHAATRSEAYQQPLQTSRIAYGISAIIEQMFSIVGSEKLCNITIDIPQEIIELMVATMPVSPKSIGIAKKRSHLLQWHCLH